VWFVAAPAKALSLFDDPSDEDETGNPSDLRLAMNPQLALRVHAH
jgi:hypothetical protein